MSKPLVSPCLQLSLRGLQLEVEECWGMQFLKAQWACAPDKLSPQTTAGSDRLNKQQFFIAQCVGSGKGTRGLAEGENQRRVFEGPLLESDTEVQEEHENRQVKLRFEPKAGILGNHTLGRAWLCRQCLPTRSAGRQGLWRISLYFAPSLPSQIQPCLLRLEVMHPVIKNRFGFSPVFVIF